MALTPGLSHGQATRKARPLQRMNHNYEYMEMKTTIFFILYTLQYQYIFFVNTNDGDFNLIGDSKGDSESCSEYCSFSRHQGSISMVASVSFNLFFFH